MKVQICLQKTVKREPKIGSECRDINKPKTNAYSEKYPVNYSISVCADNDDDDLSIYLSVCLSVCLSVFICSITNNTAQHSKKQWNRMDEANNSYSRTKKQKNENKSCCNNY